MSGSARTYQRNYPRVPAALPVEIALPDGAVIHATAVNLSPAGIQISGDRITVERILPRGEARAFVKSGEMRIRLRIPGEPGTPAFVSAWCSAVFSRRLAAEEYRIGLQFHRFEEDDAYEQLERYVEDTFHDRRGG